MSGTSSDSFKISSLRQFRDKDDSHAKYFIQVPKFQRGIVWPSSKKAALIASIKNGYPIGALMFYVTKDTSQYPRQILQVIDGLQRSTAIGSFLDAPLAVSDVVEDFLPADFFVHVSSLLADYGFELKVGAIKDLVEKWAKETTDFLPAKGFKSSVVRQRLEATLDTTFQPGLTKMLEDYLDINLIQFLTDEHKKIENYEIPAIIYSGDDTALPDIFEALNSGTPLTKYDKFAASWNSTMCVTKSAEIREFVHARYSSYSSKDWEVANFDLNKPFDEDALNFFEYLVGLGHLLSAEFPYIFPAAETDKGAPSWGFSLATVAYQLRLSDMKSLPEKAKGSALVIDLTDFELALVETCKIVNHSLSEFLSLKLNAKQDSERFLPHSELQVQSLILRLLIELYEPLTWKKRTGVTQKADLVNNIKKHYVLDILKESWKGSGDSTLFERVWSGDVQNLTRSPHYVAAPSIDEFQNALQEFHSAELTKLQRERPNVSTKTKMLLRVLYADIVSHAGNKAVQFEIEHIYPVKKLSDFAATHSLPGLPISSFGNLAILPKTDNVIKGKAFIGDYVAKHKTEPAKLAKLSEYILHPAITSIVESSFTSKDQYEEFCSSRFAAQAEQIVKFLYN